MLGYLTKFYTETYAFVMKTCNCIKPSLYQALTILPIALLTVSMIPKFFKFFSPRKIRPGSGGQFPYNDLYPNPPQNFSDSTTNTLPTFSEKSSTALIPTDHNLNVTDPEVPILDLHQIEMDSLEDVWRED